MANDETAGLEITEFVILRANLYSYQTNNDNW